MPQLIKPSHCAETKDRWRDHGVGPMVLGLTALGLGLRGLEFRGLGVWV